MMAEVYRKGYLYLRFCSSNNLAIILGRDCWSRAFRVSLRDSMPPFVIDIFRALEKTRKGLSYIPDFCLRSNYCYKIYPIKSTVC